MAALRTWRPASYVASGFSRTGESAWDGPPEGGPHVHGGPPGGTWRPVSYVASGFSRTGYRRGTLRLKAAPTYMALRPYVASGFSRTVVSVVSGFSRTVDHVKHVSIGTARYRLVCAERDGQWLAHAEREATGDRFGIECGGANEAEALDRLTRWLEWQGEHAAALEELQCAERAYHRTVAGSAVASPTGPGAMELGQESLDALEAARVRLDEIRARRPEPSSGS